MTYGALKSAFQGIHKSDCSLNDASRSQRQASSVGDPQALETKYKHVKGFCGNSKNIGGLYIVVQAVKANKSQQHHKKLGENSGNSAIFGQKLT